MTEETPVTKFEMKSKSVIEKKMSYSNTKQRT